jgi:hypothetical protein
MTYVYFNAFSIQTKGKVELLRIACLKHDELMSEATNGLGKHGHAL